MKVKVNIGSEIAVKSSVGSDIAVKSKLATQVIKEKKSWSRPLWWPPRPNPMKEGIYYLIEHHPNTKQYFYMSDADNSGYPTGHPIDIYIDGVFVKTVTNGYQSGTDELVVDSNLYGFNYKGRSFSWIFFDFQGIPNINNRPWTSLNPDKLKNSYVLESLINQDFENCILQDGGFAFQLYEQNRWFKPNLVINNTTSLYYGSQTLHVENDPIADRGYLPNQFSYSNSFVLPPFPLDLQGQSPDMRNTFYSSSQRPLHVKLINAGNLNQFGKMCQSNANLISFEMDSATSADTSQFPDISFQNCLRLQSIIMPDFNLCDIVFVGCKSLNKTSLLAYIASIRDINNIPTQTIDLRAVPDNTDPAVISAANAKNWTIIN